MQGRNLTEYLLMVGVMIVVVVALGIGVFVLRRRLFGGDDASEAGAGGMLETMRRMRDRGEIPEEEYRAAQAALVRKAQGSRPPRQPGPAVRRTPPSEPDELRARPGYDLTGAPLPRPVREDDQRHGKPSS